MRELKREKKRKTFQAEKAKERLSEKPLLDATRKEKEK